VWTDASSRDYKEDIQELSATAAMSMLQGLNLVTFKYKAAADERHVGFIAEDVPELVASSDRKGMSPMDVVAVLTRVVKEQQQALDGQNKVVAGQQEAVQEQEQINKEQQEINREQREALEGQQEINRELMRKLAHLEAQEEINRELMNQLAQLQAQQEASQELMKKLSAHEAEVKRLSESSGDGRLARIVK
jgi:hypothetical protein